VTHNGLPLTGANRTGKSSKLGMLAARLASGAAAELGGEPVTGILAHVSVYIVPVKRRDLEQRLSECGWRFLRSGGRHDVWTDGEREEPIPRHREINEHLARSILRRACGRKQ
jgi:mRNA interferase HicA